MLQTLLQNPWITVGLSLIPLILGWFVSRTMTDGIAGLLLKSPPIRFLINRMKIEDSSRVKNRLTTLVRLILFILSAAGSGMIFFSHPSITALCRRGWQSVRNTAHQSAIIILFDAVVIILLTLLIFKASGWTRRGYRLFRRRVERERGRRLNGFKIQRVEVFTADQLTDFLLRLLRYLLIGVYLFYTLIYFTILFGLFPQTRGVMNGILEIAVSFITAGWHYFVDYLPSLLSLVIIVVITRYAVKIVRFVFVEIEKGTIVLPGFYPEWATLSFQLVRIAIIALALVISFPYLPGSSSPAFKGISVFIGLLLSLGSTSLVANVVSGIVLTYTRAFRVGDRIQVADTVGDVVEKGLFVTRIRTIKNIETTIPNGIVLGSHIVNYSSISSRQGLILNTSVTIGYNMPWRQVHAALIKAAQATDGILAEPAPFVLQTSLEDFFIRYELNAYTDQPAQMAVLYSKLHENIQDSCRESGLEILSPHYRALRDGNASTIPPGPVQNGQNSKD